MEFDCTALCNGLVPILPSFDRDVCLETCADAKDALGNLDQDCISGFQELSAIQAQIASYTSANLPIAVSILVQAGSSDPETAEAAGTFIALGGISNFGDPDACRSVVGLHYCTLSLSSGELSASTPLALTLGACLPDSCFNGDPGYFPLSPNSTTPAQTIKVACGQQKVKVNAGAVAMLSVCGVLTLLVIVGTMVEQGRRLQRWAKAERAARERMIGKEKGSSGAPGWDPLLPSSTGDDAEEVAGGEAVHDEGMGQIVFFPASQRVETLAEEKDRAAVSMWEKVLLCFALSRNLNALMSPGREGPFRALDGVRVLSMLWVILGHTIVFQLLGPGFSNLYDILPIDGHGFFSRFSAMVLPSAEFSVDTFFWLSGFFLVLVTLQKLDERERSMSKRSTTQQSAIKWAGMRAWAPLVYLQRWLRLTPPYLFVIFFSTFILPLAGHGPFWESIKFDTQACPKIWWKNALYINNLHKLEDGPGDTCYGVGWYLGADFQMFVVALPLLALYRRRRSLGFALMTGIFVASISYSWAIAYKYDLSFNTFDPATLEYFNRYYSNAFTRCPPYIIGMFTGILWREAQHFTGQSGTDAGGPLPPAWARAPSLPTALALGGAAAALMGSAVYGPWRDYQDLAPAWGPARDHAYLALSKPAWASGVALLAWLAAHGRAGPAGELLAARGWAPLARLSFGAYLTHPLGLYAAYFGRVAKMHFTWVEYAFTFLGAATAAVVLAAGLYLLVERPCQNLERLVLQRGGLAKEAKEGKGHRLRGAES